LLQYCHNGFKVSKFAIVVVLLQCLQGQQVRRCHNIVAMSSRSASLLSLQYCCNSFEVSKFAIVAIVAISSRSASLQLSQYCRIAHMGIGYVKMGGNGGGIVVIFLSWSTT
jgi:hypothetical protein